MPRILTTSAVAIAVAVVALAATAVAQPDQRFGDVPPEHYAFDAAAWMADNGITTGCGDGANFCPDLPLTRAHIAAFLYRYHHDVLFSHDASSELLDGSLAIKDQYWSADGRTYFVELSGVHDYSYCEVHLTLNGRRTGEWSIELWAEGTRSEVIIDVRHVEHDFDAVDVECS